MVSYNVFNPKLWMVCYEVVAIVFAVEQVDLPCPARLGIGLMGT